MLERYALEILVGLVALNVLINSGVWLRLGGLQAGHEAIKSKVAGLVARLERLEQRLIDG